MTDWSPPDAFDEYRLIKRIGDGQMGLVYLAFDGLLARHVALKFVGRGAPDDATRARFLVEARAAARLQHPNVVAVYRVGELAGRPYLVSEFIRGRSLDQLPRPVAWQRVLTIGIELARGLAAAHRSGVLHRDIKPSNAILADDGSVKLLDFGLAKLLEPATPEGGPPEPAGAMSPIPPEITDRSAVAATLPDEELRARTLPVSEDGWREESESRLTGAGGFLGTPDYMAPEIWRGAPATRRSDVYALGALLYELATGTPPFGGVPLPLLGSTVRTRTAPPVTSVAPGVDPRLGALIDRCLHADAARRFNSGDELRSALERLAAGGGAVAAPAGNPYRGLRSFEAEHRAFFFGREVEIGLLLDRLRSESFVLVAGDSGAGKSSVCRAGVLPLVEGEGLADGRRWEVVTLVPGRAPARALAAALAPRVAIPEDALAKVLCADPGEALVAVRRTLGSESGIVCFIDQLEELLTLAEPGEARAVADFIGRASARVPGLRVLATVRVDFLGRLAGLPHLGDEITRALYLLRPITPDRAREIIVGPAERTGVSFESEELVDLLAQTTAEAGGLPLLQFALASMWEARDRSRGLITRESLDRIGGVGGALARHADSLLLALTPEERRIARRVLVRLVTLDGTRARRGDDELAGTDARVRAVLEVFIQSRLLVARDSDEGVTYEIAHEILIASWGSLRRWLDEDAEWRRVRDQLAQAVADWQRHGRSRHRLYGRVKLAEIQAVGDDDLLPAERAFLAASRAALTKARWLRAFAVLAVPVGALGISGIVTLQSKAKIEARIAEHLRLGDAALSEARARSEEARARRSEAFSYFDRDASVEAEAAWEAARAAGVLADRRFRESGSAFEAALVLAPGRASVRTRLAASLDGRARIADDQRREDVRDELLERLDLHDPDREILGRWRAPATLIVDVRPAAALTLERYEVRGGRLAPVEVAGGGSDPSGSRALSLPPGSYRVSASAAERAPVRFPLVLGPGERAEIRLDLPRAADVPDGFVFVPAGSFVYGTTADDETRRGFLNAVPAHVRATGAYLIRRDEVTVGEWLAFLDALPPADRRIRTPAIRSDAGLSVALEPTRDGWRYAARFGGAIVSAGQGEPIVLPGRHRRRAVDWRRLPVTGVSAVDAEAFVRWLHETGAVPGARMCTELEWERAARGADLREYPHGIIHDADDVNIDITYGRASDGMGLDEVGAHPASRSPLDVDDLAGNAFEWTRAAGGAGYVGRGGAWFYDEKTARSTNREPWVETVRDPRVGVRVCATVRPR